MKKIILGFLSLVLIGNVSMAQEKATTRSKRKADVAQTQPAPAQQSAPAEQAKLKKDGSPDMRHSVNKAKKDETAQPARKLKKDGSPDMRYKENK